VALRALAAPLARQASAAGATRAMEVASVLSVRYPPLRASVADTLTITRNVYDAEGRAGPPTRVIESVVLEPGGGEEARHDRFEQLVLEPGRHQIRYQVQSALLDASGTVFVDVDVPDLPRSPLAMSALLIAGSGDRNGTRTGSLEGVSPIVPTSSREFITSDVLTGFLRVYQVAGDPVPVDVAIEIFDAGDVRMFDLAQRLDPAMFMEDGGTPVLFDVPLAGLTPGPHLLSVTARLPGGRTTRREVVFRLR